MRIFVLTLFLIHATPFHSLDFSFIDKFGLKIKNNQKKSLAEVVTHKNNIKRKKLIESYLERRIEPEKGPSNSVYIERRDSHYSEWINQKKEKIYPIVQKAENKKGHRRYFSLFAKPKLIIQRQHESTVKTESTKATMSTTHEIDLLLMSTHTTHSTDHSTSTDETTFPPSVNPNNKDDILKSKLYVLMGQSMHETEDNIHAMSNVKTYYENIPAYQVGYLMSLVKKSRDVINELFTIAVKHKDSWMALEQLKTFELLVHTDVDITNLVRQLIEQHLQTMNHTGTYRRSLFEVVL